MINDKEEKLKIAESNLFLLKGIKEKFKEKNFNKDKDFTCTIMLMSPTISYCYESISAIQRMYSRDDWKCRLIHYYQSKKQGGFCYAFKFTKE